MTCSLGRSGVGREENAREDASEGRDGRKDMSRGILTTLKRIRANVSAMISSRDG
jgi:hypothetical protein